MVDIVRAGGWLMAPIILCAVIAMGIILERYLTLKEKRVIPEDLTSKVWAWVKRDALDQSQIQTLHQGSPLGQILAAGLINRDRERAVMKDSIEDTGRHVVHELERNLDTLGTIAAISPLLGLLGTVIGMVKVFTAITTHGVGNPTVLAGGIAEALITTAAGLTVAIPALIGFRYYRNRIDALVVDMEKEAIKLVEALHRRQDQGYVSAVGSDYSGDDGEPDEAVDNDDAGEKEENDDSVENGGDGRKGKGNGKGKKKK
jgi:biopolymer transport protein ExbB